MNVFNVSERVNVIKFIRSCKSKYKCASFSNCIESQIFKDSSRKFKINDKVRCEKVLKEVINDFKVFKLIELVKLSYINRNDRRTTIV